MTAFFLKSEQQHEHQKNVNKGIKKLGFGKMLFNHYSIVPTFHHSICKISSKMEEILF